MVAVAQPTDPPYPTAPAAPSSIVAAEYFIDTDPGYGNASPITLSPGIDVVNAALSIPTGSIPGGIHRLVVRTRSASGNWSISLVREFLVDFEIPYPSIPAPLQNIVAAEYYIDTDPGFGAGTPLSISPNTDIATVAGAINVTGLPNGVHRLYIRTRSADGKWSQVNQRDFIVDQDPFYPAAPGALQNITAAEYFINTDPGIGNGTPISISSGTDLSGVVAAINTSSLTPSTTNNLFIRTRSLDGKWSMTNAGTFVVSIVNDPPYPVAPDALQNINTAEYFINTDPGIGNGIAIPLTAGTDINNIAATINTSALTASTTNNLFIRTRTVEGKWSITNASTFVVSIVSDPPYSAAPSAPQNINAAEYFIDTDPGLGSGINIPVSAATDINNIPAVLNTSSLAVGPHNLFLRTRTTDGIWSITNVKQFNIGTLTILPDSVIFTNVPVSSTATRSLVIRNNSSTVQTVTGVSVGAPFGSDFSTTRTINPGQTDTIKINFAPTSAGTFQDNISLQTSAGSYTVIVKGTSFSVIYDWVLEPVTGHNYGNVQTNTGSGFNFTLRNTGNAAITLNQVSSNDPAFVPSYVVGTVIPVNGSISVPVTFTPTVVSNYSAILKVKANAGGPDSLTASLDGAGFVPSTPPTLEFVSAAPYSGTRGVDPAAGQTGNYTYKIVYKSVDNRAPANGYPQVGIDLNGDQDFDDAGEGRFSMTKEGSSTDYSSGVVFVYTSNYSNYSNTMGYRFFANDALGNAATTTNTIYYSGPVVTFQLLDLKLFASDISFSKSNPLPGESFTVAANITNNSAFTATNVPVSFYRDTILIGSTTIPSVGPFSVTVVSRTLSFGFEGFYPIKVWADPNATLGETNILNNYAIRPIIVGSPVLPGGINVSSSVSIQQCPNLKAIFTGTATYFGTSIASNVAGAEVTINTGTSILKTTTNANGNFTLVMENPPCGGNLTYTVSVTDFTFTSNTFTGQVNIPCPPVNACAPPPPNGGGGIGVSVVGSACSQVVGTNASANIVIRYRGRNIANMWSLWDKIWKDTVKVFNNGVLIETFYTNDIPDFGSAGTFPGAEKLIPVNIPLGTTGPNVITVVATYVYNEFFQNESYFYHGVFTPMTATGGTTIMAQPNQPDLTIEDFQQTGFRSFSFVNANKECVLAGSHIVRVVDVTTPGSPVLLQENTISSLSGGIGQRISVSVPTLSIGTHQILITTDVNNTVSETSETNNSITVTVVVPAPDLLVEKITTNSTNVAIGGSTSFKAVIKNTGVSTGAFVVRFRANGVPIGTDINVTGISEKGTLTINSANFVVTTADSDCPIDITAFVDANAVISESDESNNTNTMKFASDINPTPLTTDFGSSNSPVRVRVNTSKTFNVYVRNIGNRDITKVSVKFMHDGNQIGATEIPLIRAGIERPAVASFTHTFTSPGAQVVTVITDTSNTICEIVETNNSGSYHVIVTDSKEDLQVLSQFISPSSLNPNAGQNITIVGTVKNIGNRISPASSMRFFVDNIQLGNPIPFNTLQIGQDTTVAASATYSSNIGGVKVVKIVVDQEGLVSEEDELNNEATRIIIVGDAPDMARSQAGAIRFNPTGFSTGDSVTVSYSIRNNGPTGGTAWVRFQILDETDAVVELDSVQFTLAGGASTVISKKMLFNTVRGNVVATIVRCSPLEFDLLNNADTLSFSTVQMLTANLVINGDLDMTAGIIDYPGWIGGKLVLGNFDLLVNGRIINFDTAHFVVTTGTGKLKFANSSNTNTYPVGAALFSPNFVNINNTGAADNYAVRVLPYVLKNGKFGDTVRTANVNRTWMIEEETIGGSNATIEMFWNANNELPGFDRNNSRTAHYTGVWTLGDLGAASIDANGIFSRAQAGYTNFSPFTVTSGAGTALPLRFIKFTATPKNGDVLLNWITEAETNSSHFEVEYSEAGMVYNTVGRLASRNRSGQQSYDFSHQSPIGNTLFYRIKQVDLDGKFQYSRVIKVTLNGHNRIVLYPNPAQHLISISNVQLSDIKGYRILDNLGRTIKVLSPGNSLQINVSDLKNGVYFLQIIRKDHTEEMRQFIKQ